MLINFYQHEYFKTRVYPVKWGQQSTPTLYIEICFQKFKFHLHKKKIISCQRKIWIRLQYGLQTNNEKSTRPFISQSMYFLILKLCQYYEILSLAHFIPKVYLQFPTVRRLTKYNANSKNVRICHLHLRMLHFLKLNKLFYDALINSLWYSKMNLTSYLSSSTQTRLCREKFGKMDQNSISVCRILKSLRNTVFKVCAFEYRRRN